MTAPLEPLIQLGDVETRLGETLIAPETTQVEDLIEYASAMLRAFPLRIDSRIAAGTLDATLVKGVVVTAVVRALDSMRIGLRVRSEQYPEISTTYADAKPSLIYFDTDDLATLSPTVGAQSNGAFSIRPGPLS